jgi:hypothetical protein
MNSIEFTRVKYSGSDAQILALLTKLLESPTENSQQATEPHRPDAELTLDEPERLKAIAARFYELLDKAATNGSVGQKKAMTQWLIQDGKAQIDDLVSASGVADRKRYGPIGGALSRNMKAAGGPPKSCTGIPHYPAFWYGWIKDGATGREEYIVEPTLLPYLKTAFRIAN